MRIGSRRSYSPIMKHIVDIKFDIFEKYYFKECYDSN